MAASVAVGVTLGTTGSPLLFEIGSKRLEGDLDTECMSWEVVGVEAVEAEAHTPVAVGKGKVVGLLGSC